MARLGMLYAITDEALAQLEAQDIDQMYDYMLEEIEEELFNTSESFEINKAWEGVQFCLGEGTWNEENKVPYNVVFGGELILDHNDYVISLKKPEVIKDIVAYLEANNLQETIKNNFDKIPEEDFTLPKNENCCDFLLEWSKGLLEFYKNALEKQLNVIFIVDI